MSYYRRDHHPFLVWGNPGDGQGARLFALILAALIGALVLIVLDVDRGDPEHGEHPTCATEDEVMVMVEDDAFDLEAGVLRCVHIDNLEDTQP